MTDHVDPCLDRYLAGQASEEDVLALGERLRADPALRKKLLVLTAFDAELPGALRVVAREKKEKVRVTVPMFPPAGARRAPARTEERRSFANRFLWPVAIAAGILAIVGLVAYSTGRSARPGHTGLATTAYPSLPVPAPVDFAASKPVATPEGRLTAISGEVWVAHADGEGQPVPVEVGRQVFAGEAIVTGTNATAQFAYTDGSTLRIYRDSTVVLSRTDAGPGLDLRWGALDADIRKQPDGRRMNVFGVLMHAKIVGTEFRLIADPQSRWLGVRSGVVETIRVADGQKLDLHAGNYAAVVPDWPYMRMNARMCSYWKQISQQAAGMPYP